MDQNGDQQRPAEAAGSNFTTTHWTVILRAKDHSEAALSLLCARYRSALLIWLRSRGTKPDEAEDLVQGFFAHLLGHNFLAGVAPEKGRFRTFLLTSFRHYLADQWDRERAQRRGGGLPPCSLDVTGDAGRPPRDPPTPADGPDLAYDRAWAQAVLARSLERLREEGAHRGGLDLCVALEPTLFGDQDAAAYAELGQRFGLSEGAVKMTASRNRKRLKGLIRDEVLQTLAQQEDLEDELRYLRSLFRRKADGRG